MNKIVPLIGSAEVGPLGENGLPSDIGIRDAVTLNRIDDWKCYHEAVLKLAGAL